MKTLSLAAAAAIALSLPISAAPADIPRGDVHVTIGNGRLATGLIAEDDSFIIPGVRVFYGELGADIPNVAEDPGFKAEPGTFTPGTSIGFDITRALRVWNGTDFSLIPASTMTLSLATASVTSPLNDVLTHGFSIPADASGEFHHHPAFTLNAPASAGIYLFDVTLTGTNLQSAQPIWMLWNQNSDAATAQAAYDFASATIPAPAGGALLFTGCATLFWRRR